MVKAIPEGYQTITPSFIFKDSHKAIDFYKRAFGAKERYVMPGPGGKGVAHAELLVGSSIIMMCDENMFEPCKSAQSLGASPVTFYVYVENIDASFKQAVNAGAKSKMAPEDMFWGDRVGSVIDPFGYTWTFATHKKELSQQEIAKAAEAAMEQKANR